MSYVAAVDHLHGLGQELASTAPRRKFDLAHMRVLAAALGDPQKQFPAVLIAGTNGKGSTAATLASICAAAGLRTALYTSPHLSRVTERIRTAEPAEAMDEAAGAFALQEIPEEQFARLYFLVDETAQRLVATGELPHAPSFFESLTALAFLYFAERKVEIAILEVGLGGRLDATNIVDPMLAVITDIALDHQEYLGETIAEIAREKAGIMRPHGTLVTLPQHRGSQPVDRRCGACARRACYRCGGVSSWTQPGALPGGAGSNGPVATEYLRDSARRRALAGTLSAGRRASAAQHCTGDCRGG